MTLGEVQCDLEHRRFVASLYMLYRVFYNPFHSVNAELPDWRVAARLTRCATVMHDYALTPVRFRTGQFMQSFVPRSVADWSSLEGFVWV